MERRAHLRSKVLKPVKCTCEGGVCQILDISVDGACVMTDRAYDPGSIVRLRLQPPRLARVVWREGLVLGRFMMGLKFLTPGS
jgi:hypothetical protein